MSIKQFWYKSLIDREFTVVIIEVHLAACIKLLITSQHRKLITMIHRKSILGFNAVAALVMILASATTAGTTILDAQAQNADTPEQIKDYLTQAIQALESGDNAKAIQQLKLANDQIDGSTGVSTVSSNGESADEGEGAEKGPGEDADEPGDVDQNDEED